jgi:hypothetical protein
MGTAGRGQFFKKNLENPKTVIFYAINLKLIIKSGCKSKEFSIKFGKFRFFTYLCTMIDFRSSTSTLLS